MQKYSDVVQDTNGNAVVGASVTIKVSADNSTATIYSTNTGTALSNPITTDSDGRFTFYAKDGTYYAAVSKSGITAENGPSFTLSDPSGFTSAAGYGVIGDGVTVETVAVQAAITSGKDIYFPAGTYLLRDAITCATKGQIIRGAGRQKTIFLVDSSFNLSASGVFVASSGEEGPQFRDLKIKFSQPDTSTRASLVAYPPALYMRATPRFTVANMAITNAMTGIDMQGNSGGAFIDQLEMSAYNIGIDIDGSLDSVRISRLHFWTFDLTTDQASIFNDSTTIGVRSGRCDDLHVSDCLFIGHTGTALKLITGTGGAASDVTFGACVNTGFDSYGGYVQQAGYMSMAGCYFSTGYSANQAIKVTGGQFRGSSLDFTAAVATTNALVEVSGTAGAYVTLSSCTFRNTGDMKCAYVAASSGNNTLSVTASHFVAPANASPSNALVHCASGGRLTFIGNRVSDKGTGSGNFVQVDADDHHLITGNAFVGWSLSSVNPQTFAQINNNSGADDWISYTPTVTSGSGSLTSTSATGRYKQVGKRVDFQFSITVTTNGTGATQINATLPVTSSGASSVSGRASAVSGKQLQCTIASGTAAINIRNYDNTYPAADGEILLLSGSYRSA